MDNRVNILIPEALYNKANELIDKGIYSNLSEMIREGLRKQILDYDKIIERLRDNKELLTRLKRNQA